MHALTKLIYDDMKPALGVTEPGAIAYASAVAKSYLCSDDIQAIRVRLNSGMLKNAFTCGIPGSDHVGSAYAAALGVLSADAAKGLECLDGITDEDNKKAQEMIEAGIIKVELTEITSRIYIEVTVKTKTEEATVIIRDMHTNITDICVNGEVKLHKELDEEKTESEHADIHDYTLRDMLEYVKTVDYEEIAFIKEAYTMNYKLFEVGLNSPKTTFARFLLNENDGRIISEDERKTARLLCGSAVEARVIGLNAPAMSITGSGAHGIIATMPLLACAKVNHISDETLLRATALSYLICMYIKEYSGRLSAFCGCAIAAGTGMACGLLYLKNGTLEMMNIAIRNMASSITGMICDGGNQGCTMKGITAVDAAYEAVLLAQNGIGVDCAHGINGNTPEETMRYMGMIASPGMIGTEKTILDIMEEKAK